MDIFDLLLVPLYIGLFYFLAQRTVSKNANNPLYRTYYIRGLVYKFIGAMFFALIYLFYYKGGDSLAFYDTVNPMYKLFFSHPTIFWRFITGLQSFYPVECLYHASMKGVMYLTHGKPTLTTIRVASLLNMLSFNSYLVLGLWFAYLSYTFQWKAFNLLANIYPTLHKQLAYAFLMIPSVIFWGSNVGKDSIMMAAIMYLFYNFYHMAILRRNVMKHLFLFIVSAYLISLIRGFILYTMIPCMMLMAATYYRNTIKSSALRVLIGPLLLVIGGGVSLLFIQSLGQAVDSYSLDSLQQKAEGFQSWHSYLGETQGGSSYSLGGGDVEYSASGILRQAPMAVLITLYGPFIWQVRSPVMLLSVMESMLFLYFTFKLLFNRRIYSLLGILFKDHIVVFCLPLVLILAIAIGLTSFNYGALVRYKIPILPFFATMFVVINYHLNAPARPNQ